MSKDKNDDDELINEQIKNLQDQGVEFHYNREDRLQEKGRRYEDEIAAGSVRRRRILFLTFVITASMMVLYFFQYKQRVNFSLTGEHYGVWHKVDIDSVRERVKIKLVFHPSEESPPLPSDGRVQVILLNGNQELLREYFPVFAPGSGEKNESMDAEMSLRLDEFEKADKLRVLSPVMGLNGDITIK